MTAPPAEARRTTVRELIRSQLRQAERGLTTLEVARRIGRTPRQVLSPLSHMNIRGMIAKEIRMRDDGPPNKVAIWSMP